MSRPGRRKARHLSGAWMAAAMAPSAAASCPRSALYSDMAACRHSSSSAAGITSELRNSSKNQLPEQSRTSPCSQPRHCGYALSSCVAKGYRRTWLQQCYSCLAASLYRDHTQLAQALPAAQHKPENKRHQQCCNHKQTSRRLTPAPPAAAAPTGPQSPSAQPPSAKITETVTVTVTAAA